MDYLSERKGEIVSAYCISNSLGMENNKETSEAFAYLWAKGYINKSNKGYSSALSDKPIEDNTEEKDNKEEDAKKE